MLLAAPGCAIVDQYSGRAIVYNLQAEQAQQQQLLLNIVRASQRRPMQFTGLQTITGTASASGNISATDAVTHSTPLISLFGTTPANTNAAISRTVAAGLGAGGSISGGPTFTVPVLDTQEFYQGLLTPISGQLLDLYLQAGYPKDVLFNLVIERIILKRNDGACGVEVHTPQCELIVRNYVLGEVDLELFQSLMGYFIRLGLNTEPVHQKTVAAKGKADDKAADSGPKLKPFAFCFAPRDAAVYRHINRAVLCGHPAAGVQLKASEIGRKAVIAGVPLQRDFIEHLYAISVQPALDRGDPGAEGYRALKAFAGKQVSVSFHTRSIEEILYYLGEVVRRASRPTDVGNPRVQVRVGPPQNAFPVELCPLGPRSDGYSCRDLFVVEQGGLTTSGISVDYEGQRYSVSADTDASWSMAVLDIVKQLLAVNTSAKQLPATNLISVISQ